MTVQNKKSKRVYATNADRQRAYRMRQLSAGCQWVLKQMVCSDGFIDADMRWIGALKRRGLITDRPPTELWKFKWALTPEGYAVANRLREPEVVRTVVRVAQAFSSRRKKSGRKSGGSSRAGTGA